jgi:hypothetical protein
MAYSLSLDILERLGFHSVQTIPDDGRLLIWENRDAGRRILVSVAAGVIFYDIILPSGRNQEIGQAIQPTNDVLFENQLRSIGWL